MRKGKREDLQGNKQSKSVTKPGKWDKSKVNEYVHSINHDFVTQVIDNAEFKSAFDLNEDLKKILIDPGLEVFPRIGKSFVKMSNNTNMYGYDKQCFLSRKEYHKAKHKNNIERSTISYNNMIIKRSAAALLQGRLGQLSVQLRLP